MIVNDIINIFENYAPSQLQESYDNSGLITGNKDLEISNILITLDCTEDVVEEAIANKCNMIICLLYTSPSPRDRQKSRMPSSA